MAEQSWTDPAYAVVFKTVHVDELQDAINAWEDAYGIAETTFTDDEPTTATKIDALLFTEMQDALDALYQLTDASDFSWTTAAGYQFGTVSGVDGGDPLIEEVRDNMNFMQDQKCYQCDTCDTEGCTCDSECDSDGCDLCDATCDVFSCTCNAGCYTESCGCFARCHIDVCTCDGNCYDDCGKQGCDCYGPCYYGFSCTCNGPCNAFGCTTCHGGCHGRSCTCDSTCDSDACDQCDATCYEHTCSQCDGEYYRYPWS